MKRRLESRTPDTHEEDRPHYLHHSMFRSDPDLKYEQQLSKALLDLEKQLLSLQDVSPPQDTLWQILLGHEPSRKQRGDDSIQFEEKNSGWEYRLVTSEWAEEFVTLTLSLIPGLSQLYHSYPHDVLRADLLRYLILWYFGGYYADMDTFPKRPIKGCREMQDSILGNEDPDVSLVVGVEIDEPFASPQKMHDWHWVRRYGFIQYTLYAPRRFSPLLREVIVRVLSHTKRHLEEANFFFGAKYNEMGILEITGPGVFTDAVLDVLSDTLPTSHPLIADSVRADTSFGDLIPPGSTTPVQRVTWAPFYRLDKPLCVKGSEAKQGKQHGGLCVMPINVWGNGQRHSRSEGFENRHACVNHRFSGTWKPGRQNWMKYLLG
ncbi:uncharacterized protein N7459_007722 [Penicillium hispanicum]|uniref:uncharacterized protein n=1 Tax=Penicillium hispanicum TaxID=1080232 RepID=UPI0025424979|nr:uncharacterized protein N7459_007722 [Penicillium hispanicum]KAJ5578758.1 hypothetical protein N7459_007722 [Penicillium hispanicum]